ncbi:MAG: GNAT family N-acetyltransferase [Rikenellaceae bacterium]
MENSITFEVCDFSNPAHLNLLVELHCEYMADPMGDHPAHSKLEQLRLVDALNNREGTTIVFACDGDRGVGMAICFELFSTFQIKPYMYIHDFIVTRGCRNKGVGRRLMEQLFEISRQRGYCKVTLEVRCDNPSAQSLYRSSGFEPSKPDMYFWTKSLTE